MKQRLLILSDPPTAPGYLPRLRFLCNYLHEQGYTVHVFTEESAPLNFEHAYPITTIKTYSGSTMDWLIKAVWSLLTNWHERHFASAIKHTIQGEQYDKIFCTTFSAFPMGTAVRLKKHLHIPLYLDIRDLDEQVDHSTYQYAHKQWWLQPFRGLYRAIQLRRRNRALAQADMITTVSPWHVEFLKQFNSNVHLIYNGFDPKQFYPKNISTNTFQICYIGSLFNFHNPQPLLDAVRELNLPNIEVVFHTPQHDPIPHTQLGDTICQSSIMLIFTSTNTHGMMTTKFSEILGCEKPILCIPSDKGCLRDAIAQTHAGIATDSIDEIKAFIMDKYKEWKELGYTHQQVSDKELFNRQHIAHEFEDLLRCNTDL